MDIDAHSFDTALLTAVTAAASRPAIVRPYFDPIDDAAKWEKNFARRQAETEKNIRDWEEEGRRGLQHLAHVTRLIGRLNDQQMAMMAHAAEAIEQKTAEYTGEMGRTFKQLRKLARKMADVSHHHRRVIDEAADRMELSSKQEMQARLDAALFFRALRAEYDPTARGGPAFDDSNELARYLDDLVA